MSVHSLNTGLTQQVVAFSIESSPSFPPTILPALPTSTEAARSLGSKIVAVIPPKPKIGSFEEVIRRVPQEDLRKIESYLQIHQENLKGQVKALLALFRKPSLKNLNEVINDPQQINLYFFVALLGLKEGTVPFGLFCRIAELLPISELKKEAIDCVDEEGNFNQDLEENLRLNLSPYLSEGQIEEYRLKLSKLSWEERLVFVHETQKVDVSKLDQKKILASKSITTVLEYKQGFRVLDFTILDTPLRTSFSDAAFQLFLQLFSPDTAVEQNVVLGYSQFVDIRGNGFTDTRDVGLSYVVPEEEETYRLVCQRGADGFETPEGEFRQHDRYHCFLVSNIPAEIRIKSNQLADRIRIAAKEKKNQLPLGDYDALRKFAWWLTDMDMGFFYEGKVKGDFEIKQDHGVTIGSLQTDQITPLSLFLFSVIEMIFVFNSSDLLICHNLATAPLIGLSDSDIQVINHRVQLLYPKIQRLSVVLEVFQKFLQELKKEKDMDLSFYQTKTMLNNIKTALKPVVKIKNIEPFFEKNQIPELFRRLLEEKFVVFGLCEDLLDKELEPAELQAPLSSRA